MAPAFSQELPPPGGYSRVPYERVPAKSIFTGRRILVGYLLSMGYAFFGIKYSTDRLKAKDAEQMSGHLAVLPFFLAEGDRRFLKQLRENRDEEADLMKNVKGWEVGTLFGTPVYSTLGADEWVEPQYDTVFVHANPREAFDNAQFRHTV